MAIAPGLQRFCRALLITAAGAAMLLPVLARGAAGAVAAPDRYGADTAQRSCLRAETR